MVEIVHLALRQRPPKGALLIECKRGHRSQELVQDEHGAIWRVRPEEFDEVIAQLSRQGAKTVYVRGAPST
jgi:hypothetical protein